MGYLTILYNAFTTACLILYRMLPTRLGDPRYSSAWNPTSDGGYVWTCIFLIILGAILRSLVTAKSVLEQRWSDAELQSRYVKISSKEHAGDDLKPSIRILTDNRLDSDGLVMRRPTGTRPRRTVVDGVKAAIDTVIAGILCWTMLYIMQMNTCYLFSVLCGIFLGGMAV